MLNGSFVVEDMKPATPLALSSVHAYSADIGSHSGHDPYSPLSSSRPPPCVPRPPQTAEKLERCMFGNRQRGGGAAPTSHSRDLQQRK